jgi:hypothetical protein
MKPMQRMFGMKPISPMEPMKAPVRWWLVELGESPNSSGGQSGTRYAFFAERKRLAVDAGNGEIRLYETGDHRVSGVHQHQSGNAQKIAFTSQHGEVDLAALKPA